MKKRGIALIFVGISLFVLTVIYLTSSDEMTPKIECVTDSDCAKAGCSNQLCTTTTKSTSLITSCEWKEEYQCYQNSTCSCVNGKCNWKEQNELNNCLKKFS